MMNFNVSDNLDIGSGFLPTVQNVSVGHYDNSERYKFADATINQIPDTKATWGVRVVLFPEIPQCDWERGARGEGDFWDLVKREVLKLSLLIRSRPSSSYIRTSSYQPRLKFVFLDSRHTPKEY